MWMCAGQVSGFCPASAVLRAGNTYVTNTPVYEFRYYVASGGKQPFGEWFEDLEPVARAKVTRALVQLGHGNFSNVKSVGEGVLEYRIDSGPGYRVYFGRDGDTLIILLTGGTKRRQQRDIEAAYLY